jgi:hypothetical protein
LSACSGGQGAPPVFHAPAVIGAAGYSVGSSFYFVGTSANRDTLYDGAAAQNVTGTSTGSGNEFNQEQVLGDASFGGMTNLLDFREYVSYVAGAPYTDVFDNYETIAQSGNSHAELLYVGNQDVNQITPDDRISSSSVNATPQVIDVLPHAAAPAYAENPRSSYASTETSPALGTLATAIGTNADGSYARVDNATYPGGSYVQNWQTNADFSGSHTVTLGSDTYASTEDDIAAPAGGTITVTHATGNGSVPPQPVSGANFTDWYVTVTGAAPVLYLQTNQNVGAGPLPAACKVSSALQQSPVWDIRTIVDYFDVWGNGASGETYSTSTQDEFVSDAAGELCVVNSMTISAYSTQTGYLIERAQSSGALALQSAQVPAGSSSRTGQAVAPVRADAALRLRAATLRFVRRAAARGRHVVPGTR